MLGASNLYRKDYRFEGTTEWLAPASCGEYEVSHSRDLGPCLDRTRKADCYSSRAHTHTHTHTFTVIRHW
jgi:hypothetical protein